MIIVEIEFASANLKFKYVVVVRGDIPLYSHQQNGHARLDTLPPREILT